MPLYDAYAVYTDPILTGLSVGFEDQTLVGERLFPITRTPLSSGRYRVFDRSAWMVFPDRREPGTVANEIRAGRWSEDNFMVQEHSLQAAVTDEERQNVAAANQIAQASLDADLSPEADATELVTRAIRLRHELEVSTMARNTANYAAGHSVTLAGVNQWSDYSGTSDPFKDISAGLRAIYADTRQRANLMLVPWEVWTYMEHHPKVIARYQYFRIEPDPPEAIRQLTGFDGEVVLADASYNAADNPDATEAMTSFWGKDVIIARVDEREGMRIKTFAKTFVQPYDDGNVRTVDRWREEPRKSDVIRASMKYDAKIVSNAAGYIIKAAVA